jgi:MFS family permease
LRRLFADLPPEVAVMSAVALSVAVGFGVVAPAIPVFAREFGVGRTAAGAVISAFAFMRLAFALAGGRLVDRFGERVILAAGIGIVAVSSLLAGLAQSYGQLLLLRGAGGIGSAMFTVSSASLLLRVVGPEQRGRAMGMWQGGFIIGGISGPALGGVLTKYSLRLPFFVYAATLAVAGGIAMVYLARAELRAPEPEPTAANRAGSPVARRTTLGDALRHPAYRAALVGNLGVGYVAFGARNSLIPLFVLEGLRRDPVWTGIGFVVTSAAQAVLLLPAGRFSDRRGRKPALLLGGAASTASALLLALSATLPAYLLAMLLFGIGFAYLGPASGAVVGDVMQGRGGTVVAVFQMASDIGAIAGPLIAGWLADSYSYGAAFGSCALVLAVGVALVVPMPESRARPAGGA